MNSTFREQDDYYIVEMRAGAYVISWWINHVRGDGLGWAVTEFVNVDPRHYWGDGLLELAK